MKVNHCRKIVWFQIQNFIEGFSCNKTSFAVFILVLWSNAHTNTAVIFMIFAKQHIVNFEGCVLLSGFKADGGHRTLGKSLHLYLTGTIFLCLILAYTFDIKELRESLVS